MISREQLYRACDAIDKEYAEVIKPILEQFVQLTHEALGRYTEDWVKSICKEKGIKYELDYDWGDCEILKGRIRYGIPDSMVEYMGYSRQCPSYASGRLASVATLADAYRKNDLALQQMLIEKKKEFNSIVSAFNDDLIGCGRLVDFAKYVKGRYDYIAGIDTAIDTEFKSLFCTNQSPKKYKVTIKIEEEC